MDDGEEFLRGLAPTQDAGREAGKRKAEEAPAPSSSKKTKTKPAPAPKVNSAIYVTNLPLDAKTDELFDEFSRYGLIAESVETDEPRIKIYTDDKGKSKGEALIIYHDPISLRNAIFLRDGTDLRPGKPVPSGPMKVVEADLNYKKEVTTEPTDQPESQPGRRPKSNKDREKRLKKVEEMKRRLADWSDDEDATPRRSIIDHSEKHVVFKHMFDPDELREKPSERGVIREDIREMCEKYGVTVKVKIYNDEPEGIVTVRFKKASEALSAAQALNGRRFDGRVVEAFTSSGSIRSVGAKPGKEIDTRTEEQRIEDYGKFLEQEEEEDDSKELESAD